MPMISKKELQELRTRVEVAENFIMEGSTGKQQEYLECLDTYSAFSKEVYQHIQATEPVSELEEEAKFNRALKALEDSYFMEIHEIISYTEKFKNVKSVWGSSWSGLACFAYYLGLTDKKQEVR